MSAKARRLSKKELLRRKTTSERDPLQGLRSGVQRRQGYTHTTRASATSASNRGLVDYLLGNVGWSKLLPLVIPLVLAMLRRKQNTAPQPAQQATGQLLGGTSQASPSLVGLLGSLLGGGSAPQTQPQPQADAMGGLLGALLGGGSAPETQAQPQTDAMGGLLGALLGGGSTSPTQAQPQTDAMGGLLGALLGGGGATSTQAQPQADALSGLLQTLSGVQGTKPRPQAGTLSGLLQALNSSRSTQFEQQGAWGERGPTARAQTGSVLRLLGTTPESQRAADVNPLMDVLANNMDLDGDGVPDALEQMLSPGSGDEVEREGAAALLEGLLDNASADDLTEFSRAVQELLSPA